MLAALLCCFAIVADGPAADAITLRDGRVLLGLVDLPTPRGQTQVIVRRAWVETNLPDLSKRWQATEAPKIKQARKERLDRLVTWRNDRGARAADADPVLEWVDRERAQLRRPFDPADIPLMRVVMARSESKKIDRRDEAARRMLRQAWVAGVDGPESMTPGDLQDALAKANVARIGEELLPLEEFLPEPIETENEWRLRRAATELAFDAGARFQRYEGLVVPEGQEIGADVAQQAIANLLGELIDDPARPASDPLAERLREVASQGKVGALVTRLEGGPESAIEMTLWVRTAREGWRPALVRRASAKADRVPADAGDPLANDPQIKAALGTLEALGLGKLGDDAKRLGLRSGAAVERALAEARTAIEDDLKALVLPVRTGLRPRRDQGPAAPEGK
jgi:hypothetical protein